MVIFVIEVEDRSKVYRKYRTVSRNAHFEINCRIAPDSTTRGITMLARQAQARPGSLDMGVIP